MSTRIYTSSEEARQKDAVEVCLSAAFCRGAIPLAEAKRRSGTIGDGLRASVTCGVAGEPCAISAFVVVASRAGSVRDRQVPYATQSAYLGLVSTFFNAR